MVWKELENKNYLFVPLKAHLKPRIREFLCEVRSNPEVPLRETREGFFEASTGRAWYLIHVSHSFKTVYLVAARRFEEAWNGCRGGERSPARATLTACG